MDSEIPKKLPRFHTVFPPKDQASDQQSFSPAGNSTPSMVYTPPHTSNDSQSPAALHSQSSAGPYPDAPLHSPPEPTNQNDPPMPYPSLAPNDGMKMYDPYSPATHQQPAPVAANSFGGEFGAPPTQPPQVPAQTEENPWRFSVGNVESSVPRSIYPAGQAQMNVAPGYKQRAPLSHPEPYAQVPDHMTMPPHPAVVSGEDHLDPGHLSEAFMKDMCAWIKREHDSQQLSTFNMNIKTEDGGTAGNHCAQAGTMPGMRPANPGVLPSMQSPPASAHAMYNTESHSPSYGFSSPPLSSNNQWYFGQQQMGPSQGIVDSPVNNHSQHHYHHPDNIENGKRMGFNQFSPRFIKPEERSQTSCSNMPNMTPCNPYTGYNTTSFNNGMNNYPMSAGAQPGGSQQQYINGDPYYRPIKTEPGYMYNKVMRSEAMYNGVMAPPYSMSNYNTDQHRPIYSNANVKLEHKSSNEPSDVYEFYDDCPSPTFQFGARHRMNKFPNGRIYGCNQKNSHDDTKVLSYVSCDPANDLALTSGPEVHTLANQFLYIEQNLCDALSKLSFSEPVTNIYNPLSYAGETHRDFVTKYCKTQKHILFLGMNPGPFGMAQNGIPFGEATVVREWLKIQGTVHKPSNEHPRRQVSGLQNTRKEVSGSRFWGFFQRICGTPERFFQYCFVHNMCPLVFLAKSGKNVTPPQMAVAQRRPLNKVCDHAFVDVVRLMGVKIVVGIGKFAQERAADALRDAGIHGVRVECIMHPSPANPAANKGWEAIVEKQLQDIDILKYFQVNENGSKEETS